MIPRGFLGSIAAEGRCRQASHGSLPYRFAAQGYCWWNSRFLHDFFAMQNNYLRDLTSHSFSKGGGLAANPRREREKSATKTCDSIEHEDAELGGREPRLPQQCCQRKEPDEICVAVDD